MGNKFSFQKFEGMSEIGEGETVPLIKKLKPNQYVVLSIIAMYQGKGGVCDLTQQQISEIAPYSRKVVGNTLDSLIQFEYGGKPVLTRWERRNDTGRKQYVYQLQHNPLFGVYGESPSSVKSTHDVEGRCELITHQNDSRCELSTHQEPSRCELSTQHDGNLVRTLKKSSKELREKKREEKKEEPTLSRVMKNKEVLSLFCDCFKSKTQQDYKINYPRDNRFITTFLKQTQDLTNNDKKRVVEIIVENYERWTTNIDKYPLSTKTLMTKWVQDKARKLLDQEKRELSQMKKRDVEADERQQIALQSIMARIKRKEGTGIE